VIVREQYQVLVIDVLKDDKHGEGTRKFFLKEEADSF